MPRLEPLARDDMPEFEDLFVAVERRGGEVPNLLRTLARKPEIVKALMHLRATVMAPGALSAELKNLISQMVSMSAGCSYCAAHTVRLGVDMGIPEDRQDALWSYETSALFSEAERVALRVAQCAVQAPNMVSDEDFAELRRHFSADQIVELLSVIGVFGFYNRVNDTLATELETPSIGAAERHLSAHGWEIGKHAPARDPGSGEGATTP